MPHLLALFFLLFSTHPLLAGTAWTLEYPDPNTALLTTHKSDYQLKKEGLVPFLDKQFSFRFHLNNGQTIDRKITLVRLPAGGGDLVLFLPKKEGEALFQNLHSNPVPPEIDKSKPPSPPATTLPSEPTSPPQKHPWYRRPSLFLGLASIGAAQVAMENGINKFQSEKEAGRRSFGKSYAQQTESLRNTLIGLTSFSLLFEW